MAPIYDAPASRHLDAAVARALGLPVARGAGRQFTQERDWTDEGDYYLDVGVVPKLLPGYSTQQWYEDRGALMDVVLWLARHHGVHLSIDAGGASARADRDTPVSSVPGDDLRALALVVCRVACEAAGIYEIAEETR
jgi:hypothetical protein